MTAELTGFLQYGEQAASARVRYFEWLRHTGVHAETFNFIGGATAGAKDVLHAPAKTLIAEFRLRTRIRQPLGRALIMRGASPFSRGGVEESICRSARLAVYDFDDALMDVASTGIKGIWSRPAKTRRAVAHADRVIAGNDTLATWAEEYNSDVRMIPTCIDPDAYKVKQDFSLTTSPKIVWLGSPWTEKYLEGIASALASLHRRWGARLVLISAAGPISPELQPFTDRIAWYPGIESTLADYDIAVAPLTDGPVERGKSAYKILQYAAAGLPVVGSPIGTNDTVLQRLGYIACSDAGDWADALNGLLSAQDGRREMGHAARHRVIAQFSYQAWRDEWLSALDLP